MSLFNGLKRVPAVPAKPPIDVELTNMIGAEPPVKPKKTREGRLSASQWRAARELWFSCRSFTEVAERFGISASAVSKRSAKEDWPAMLGQNVVADRAESRLEIEARVAAQLDRLGAQGKQALCEAIVAEHLRLAAELSELARAALAANPIDRVADAIRLHELAVKIRSDIVGQEGSGPNKLTITLRQQLEKFSVQKPKVTVSPTPPPQIEETGGES